MKTLDKMEKPKPRKTARNNARTERELQRLLEAQEKVWNALDNAEMLFAKQPRNY